MIVVISDTHRTAGHGLSESVLTAVREATAVVHAGDFTTPAVLEAVSEEAARVVAVHGNADVPELQDRLPAQRVVTLDGLRLALVHGHEHSTTARSLLGREAAADVVVSGHTHRPAVANGREIVLLNPGSHADPRGAPATYATLDASNLDPADGVPGAIRTVDGSVYERFRIPVQSEN